MPEPIILTDANLDSVLNGTKPIMILVYSGEGLRGDFKAAFNKAAQEQSNIVFATLDPTQNPAGAARFGAADKPVLVAWYCGEEVVRRLRPWGTDVPLAVEMLNKSFENQNPEAKPVADEAEKEKKNMSVIYDKPVAVTDQTFEEEVLNSELPVMVDFWAAWCGPCRMVAPSLDKLAKEFAGKIKIAKVDVDANPQLSQAFRVMSIPTLMIVKQRTIIFNQPGALPEPVLRDLVEQAIKIEIPPREEQEQQPEPEK